MEGYTREEILRLIQEEDVQFIRMQFTDLFGQLKNVAITVSQIERALDGEIMLDGSSIQDSARVEESDQYLHPELDTFAILPWRPQYGKVARMICNVHNPDGSPFAGDPRNVLKQALQTVEDMGLALNVGPELEFFLFETDEDGRATTRTKDEAAYFDLGPLDHGESTRQEICLNLEKMGFEIEASHHECAVAQPEIDFKYNNALDGADKIMTFKLVAKSIAQKNGLHATFMPKPIYDIAGNGMHLNMSLFKDGKNVFYDPSGERGLSKTAYSFIAGLLDHVQGFTAVTNPLVNSYKRLGAGHEAPRYRAWSASNRSALIRIPAARGQATRVELRCPDPACNPYLSLAVCLAAGLDGIEKGMTPPEEVTENIFAMSPAVRKRHNIEALPGSLEEALIAMKKDKLVMDTLGPHVSSQYIAGKEAEWDEYRTRVSSWERDKYMMNY